MKTCEKNRAARCVIISGGVYDVLPEIHGDDFVIACDKGYEYARRNNIRPDLVIADFDSYGGDVEEDIPVLRYPCEKDDTDTMAAVKYAVSNGLSEIVLCCAQGGRADHAFANIQSCVYAVKNGLKASILSTLDEVVFLKDEEISLKRKEGFSLSVFSITDESQGVTISGAKYEVRDALLTNSFPIGVSNEWKEESVRISVNSGILMVVMSKYKR